MYLRVRAQLCTQELLSSLQSLLTWAESIKSSFPSYLSKTICWTNHLQRLNHRHQWSPSDLDKITRLNRDLSLAILKIRQLLSTFRSLLKILGYKWLMSVTKGEDHQRNQSLLRLNSERSSCFSKRSCFRSSKGSHNRLWQMVWTSTSRHRCRTLNLVTNSRLIATISHWSQKQRQNCIRHQKKRKSKNDLSN